MIDLYYWPTPNGQKATIMLEEVALPYQVKVINILAGDQHEPEFRAINPNGKVPTIVDQDGPGGQPYAIFESGAILMYLAEKTGKLWPNFMDERYRVIQWLMFQMGNVGPMFGQAGHFLGYAKQEVPYARERYHREANRLYKLMDDRLAKTPYLAGDHYSIADVATIPWTTEKQQALHHIEISHYPNVARWHAECSERPAVQRGMAVMADDLKVGNPTEEAFKNLFER